MERKYDLEEAQIIANRLARVTDESGDPIFSSVQVSDSAQYYHLELKNEIGTAIVSLRKQPEED